MGMFDYVNVTCPCCDADIEEQTKQFDCIMSTINLDEELPIHIASTFAGEWKCHKCKCVFDLICGEVPQKIKLMKVIKTKGE